MKLILTIILLSTLAFAYEKGDLISDDMANHLGLTTDKIYIIDFFASWCSSCKKEIPLISMANKELDTSKVEIIGIDVDKDPKKGLNFQKQLKEHGHLNFRVINDPQSLVISEFNPTGMPTLFYIKNKKIFKITTGAVPNIDQEILTTVQQTIN